MEDPARAGCCTTAEMNPPKALPACKPPKALAALLDKLEQTAAQTLATYSPTHLKSSPPMRVKQALSPISQAGRRQQQQLRLPGHVQQDVKALIMAFIKQQHEKTGSQHENWKPYRTSKSPILLQDVPAVDASELQQALQGGALPPVKPSRRSPLAKALRAKQRREMPSLEDLELKQRRDGEMASYAWSYLVLPGPTWVVDQAPSFEYVLRKYYRTASSDVIEAMLQSGEPLMEEAISKAWKSEMREHRSEAIRHSSLETLTVMAGSASPSSARWSRCTEGSDARLGLRVRRTDAWTPPSRTSSHPSFAPPTGMVMASSILTNSSIWSRAKPSCGATLRRLSSWAAHDGSCSATSGRGSSSGRPSRLRRTQSSRPRAAAAAPPSSTFDPCMRASRPVHESALICVLCMNHDVQARCYVPAPSARVKRVIFRRAERVRPLPTASDDLHRLTREPLVVPSVRGLCVCEEWS